MPGPDHFTVLHYVGYEDDHSGIVSVIRALAHAERFQCVFGVNPGFVQHRAHPLPFVEFPAIEAESIRLGTMWQARRVAQAVRRWLAKSPDRVFHGHSRAGLLVALWLRALGEKRVVVSVHSFGRQRWFYRWASRRLGDRLFWLSPAMKAYYGVGDATWAGCMPNGLAARPMPARARERDPGKLIVGGAGMIVRWKGWHLVLEAMAALPEPLRRRTEFQHAGAVDGSAESKTYAEELRQQADRCGLTSQVKWRGWEPSSDALLAEADCVVVSSRLEPFSMIALEALFAGVPVIAADDGGPRDFISEGVTGWFFKSGDPRALAEVFARLLTTDLRQKIRIEPTMLTRFDAATVAARWSEIYARLPGSS
jgi:glycosyltransferase involved in cell wall biosynthesis